MWHFAWFQSWTLLIFDLCWNWARQPRKEYREKSIHYLRSMYYISFFLQDHWSLIADLLSEVRPFLDGRSSLPAQYHLGIAVRSLPRRQESRHWSYGRYGEWGDLWSLAFDLWAMNFDLWYTNLICLIFDRWSEEAPDCRRTSTATPACTRGSRSR